MRASKRGALDIVKLLTSLGANMDSVNEVRVFHTFRN